MAFQFAPYIPAERVESARLGISASHKLTDNDVGKPVKIGTDAFYLCSDGDYIDGFVNSIEPFTVDGYSFGGVVREGRFYAIVDANDSLALGDVVVSGANTAYTVAKAGAYPVVTSAADLVLNDAAEGAKDVTLPGNPYKYHWRVVSLLGDAGTAGCTVLIERI
jgi:hypothetical protein